MLCYANEQLLAAHSSDEQMMNRMGVRLADCPALVLMDFQNANKYRPAVGHQLTSSKIWLFVRSALDGKLKVRSTVHTASDTDRYTTIVKKIMLASSCPYNSLDCNKHLQVTNTNVLLYVNFLPIRLSEAAGLQVPL